MNTATSLVSDRRSVATLNSVGSGTPLNIPTNLRDASNRPGPNNAGPWKQPPSQISTRATTNPFSGGRMNDNLHAPRNGASQPLSGNHTASRTVLNNSASASGSGSGSGSRGITGAFGGHSQHPAKRLKTSHHGESEFFMNGAAGTGKGRGKGKGKGKEPAHSSKMSTVGAGTMETIVLSDDEDVPTRVILENKAGSKSTSATRDDGGASSSTDELDCIGPDLPPTRYTPSEPPDPFERPRSPRPRSNRNISRLPADGEHTRQLQQKFVLHAKETVPEVVDVDTPSDDIESASGFDVEDEAKAVAETEVETAAKAEVEFFRPSTPNGRGNIRPGSVKEKVQALEGKRVAKPPSKPPSSGGQEQSTPFYDLKTLPQPTSRKARMKGKNQKPLSSTAPSSRASVEAPGPLDPVATSPSGFKLNKGKGKSNANASANGNIATPIPVEAWTLGCRLSRSEDKHEPVGWITVGRAAIAKPYLLKMSPTPDMRGTTLLIHLDREVDQLEYTDAESTWDEDSVAVVKLRSTASLKVPDRDRGPHFVPGHKRAPGFITFKFMTQHPNFIDGEAYKALVNILGEQIQDNSMQRGSQTAAKAWQMVETATKGLREEPKQRQTRSNALKRPSPISAGPANDESTTILPSEHSSTSAPPSRTYGTERRTTRQSARIARKSPSPVGDPDELLLVYPPTGTGAVNITRGDLKRLDEGQYLNDTLIEFGLKLWLDDLRRSDPEKAEQVHVFNSFFYKKLSSKKEVADTYQSVRKWSSKIDIFSKKYIIVPINENFHWYLAIIENPADMLHPPPPEARNAPQTRKRKRESAAAEAEELVSEDKDPPAEDGTETATETSKQPSEQPEPSTPPNHVPDAMAVDGDSEGDLQEVDSLLEMTQTQLSVSGPARSPSRDVADGELQYPGSEDPMDVDLVPPPEHDDGRKSPAQTPIVVDDDSTMDLQAKPAEPVEDDPKPDSKEDERMSREEDDAAEAAASTDAQALNSYVYTFDSLGTRHSAAASRLAKYLRFEAQDKKGLKIDDTRLAVWKNAKSPLQTNFCDCGLFVLAFVEAFMKDPIHAGDMIRQSKAEWYGGRRENFRGPFRDRTLALSEVWKKVKEEAKAVILEGPKDEDKDKDEAAGDKEKDKEESAKEAEDKPKPKQPEATVVEDSDDDEVIISEVRFPSKASRGGKKGNNSGKAIRLR